MRHPIYIAHLAVLTGLTVGSGLTVNFALLAVSVLCTFPLMIRAEERELEKRFGAAWREYREKVPLIPGL
jgi:protein-S-isoprenylcysteine O-methyltransferase Ste14